MRVWLCAIALLGLLARAAAAPASSLATTALAGPRGNPLDDHCRGLQTDDPRTADPAQSCERVYATKLGGREVAVIRTRASPFDGGLGSEFDLLWLAIGSDVGWFVSAPVRVETFHTNGTDTISSEETVTAIRARGTILAGRPAVLLELHLARSQHCRVCVPDVDRSPRPSTAVFACKVVPVGIACTEAIWFDGPVALLHARGGQLEIDQDAASEGIARGAYALSPP